MQVWEEYHGPLYSLSEDVEQSAFLEFCNLQVALGMVYSTAHGNVLLVSGILISTLLAVISLGITLGPTLRRHLPPLSAAIAQLGFAFINMIGFKVELSNYFNVSGDDVSLSTRFEYYLCARCY